MHIIKHFQHQYINKKLLVRKSDEQLNNSA